MSRTRFPNLARRADAAPEMVDEVTAACKAELEAAGIKTHTFGALIAGHGEVPSKCFGEVEGSGWSFRRAWYYWVAEGPGLPPEYAEALHETHGRDVRVEGHCGCPSPLEWAKGFGVGQYHVDTVEGLKALAETLKTVLARRDRAALLITAGPSPVLLAARAVMAVRPTNWDDDEDPAQAAAWTALQDALKPAGPDDLGCGICTLGFVQGDPCLTDVDLGPVHAACCGPERESYVGPDGEPLKEGQPIPTPWIWADTPTAPTPLNMIDSECIHPGCGCGEGPCKATGGATRPGGAAHG